MSAESVVYYLNRVPASDPNDQTEWLLTALGQYTDAELRELLYVAEEPGFFELMRGLFALSDESRAVLQQFLETGRPAGHGGVDRPERPVDDRASERRAARKSASYDRKIVLYCSLRLWYGSGLNGWEPAYGDEEVWPARCDGGCQD